MRCICSDEKQGPHCVEFVIDVFIDNMCSSGAFTLGKVGFTMAPLGNGKMKFASSDVF